MSDDGGMQWWAEVGQQEQEQRKADEDARLLAEHRKWVKNFNQENEHGTANPEG